MKSTHSHSAREQILHALHHLDHILPAQAPILNFVHHNTIHGFQHLPFEEALAEFEKLTGIEGYLPEAQHRTFYEKGRIDDSDLFAALSANANLQSEQIFCELPNRKIYRKELYRLAMLFDFSAISASQFTWKIQESNVLKPNESLWQHILDKLDLTETELHVEDLFDLTPEQVANWQNSNSKQHVEESLTKSFSEIGNTVTLRGFIANLTGMDCLNFVRPQLIRLCASALDEGVAAWSVPNRSDTGLYGMWRAMLDYDANAFLAELPNAPELLAQLPDDVIDTIIFHLEAQHIPQEKWDGYLQRLALEIPGWAGMINWREQHLEYTTENDIKPKLADFLAIRLTLDRLYLNQICRDFWQCDARLDKLQTYFERNLAEFSVRSEFYAGNLPEYLSQQAQDVLNKPSIKNNFEQLADLISTWQNSPLAKTKESIYDEGWRLFCLCQHLDLNAAKIEALSSDLLREMLKLLDDFNDEERNKIWLVAYERHYRNQIFHGLTENYQRGRWYKREKRPSAQLIFCMDDREEAIRRHLEELNPEIETLGAAGFFGVPMNYKGLDDEKVTPLCPVVVVPSHEVQEIPTEQGLSVLPTHQSGRKKLLQAANVLHQSLRRNTVLSYPLIDVFAPFTLANLLGKSLIPKPQNSLMNGLTRFFMPEPETKLHFSAENNSRVATPELPRLGFTDIEQADRVAGFLRNTGLTYGFAEIVVLMGHGSISQNNPHLAAYDCGACSGRHGGPNARVFAAMANRPEIRILLAERGIEIPTDTWFVGSEHNTCNEIIDWYDVNEISIERANAFKELQQQLQHAQKMSAHERCRRLASAPKNPTPSKALFHIQERATDFSQARPELGHATNAFAVVGRRALTQGAFFDRRAFLISYDPTQDPEGKTLEGILLAVGPVGAGINLEYYFSTVNNERFGCSTKIPHNITGLFAVMEGASSDLRTGLPRQMIEIHEAMRLQIIVEAKTSVLEQIYARQPSLSELIGGGWVHLSAKDPDSEDIFVFERGVGFVRWQAEKQNLPIYEKSSDYYPNHSEPLPPVLIKQPE
ncbi:UPF0753 protein [Methylococcaceae bacterium]|nr:UPF0753 protein [Methylococcaceae bacterium]